MDFSQAQFEGGAATPGSTACQACQQPLVSQYFSANGLTVCANCAQQLQAGPPPGGAFLRVLKAFLFGSGAGLVGAIGYGLIIHYAKVELALVTILIGWMVGRSIRFGSEHRGGRGYQVMGAILTYVFCMMAYVPDIVVELTTKGDDGGTPYVIAVLLAPFIALVVPFTGAMGILGTLILVFGIWQGWKEPAKAVIVVEGPFALGAAPPEPAPAPAAAP